MAYYKMIHSCSVEQPLCRQYRQDNGRGKHHTSKVELVESWVS